MQGEVYRFDLRSDTVTKPTAKMREAMANAEVGDDVFNEDPTVHKLQAQAAKIVGHEAALFVPSGCMGNQIALQLHTKPGDDVILEASSHVYLYELGGMASWAGVVPRLIHGAAGRIQAEQVKAQIPPNDETMAQASLLVLENSHNHAGGTVLPLEQQTELLAVAREAGHSGIIWPQDKAAQYGKGVGVDAAAVKRSRLPDG